MRGARAAILRCRQFVVLSDVLYLYNQRSGSAIHSHGLFRLEAACMLMRGQKKLFLENINSVLVRRVIRRKQKTALYFFGVSHLVYLTPDEREQAYKDLFDTIRETLVADSPLFLLERLMYCVIALVRSPFLLNILGYYPWRFRQIFAQSSLIRKLIRYRH